MIPSTTDCIAGSARQAVAPTVKGSMSWVSRACRAHNESACTCHVAPNTIRATFAGKRTLVASKARGIAGIAWKAAAATTKAAVSRGGWVTRAHNTFTATLNSTPIAAGLTGDSRGPYVARDACCVARAAREAVAVTLKCPMWWVAWTPSTHYQATNADGATP